MDLVIKESEASFAAFLASIAEKPDFWMCVHINMAALNEETLNSEGLSGESLDKIHRASDKIARGLCLGLKLKGSTFLFEDGDVASLFLCAPPASDEIVEKLRHAFTLQGFGQFFHSHYIKDKLASLISLSQEKKKSAEDYKLKRCAVARLEDMTCTGEPDAVLAKTIQKQRRAHAVGVILLIEDDLIARGMIASALQKEYTVLQAKDARSGVAAYIANAPDMVLLDIHLPDHDGHKVLDRLKFLDPEAYVVMVSADAVVNNVLSTNACGSSGFIKKPFSKDKILAYIKRCPTL
jgi:two-component system, chemotaxis family, chemotaxis protein CheY